MRKRHVARPHLESMEDRLALSALSAHAVAAAEVRAARASKLEAREAAHAAKHQHKHEAATRKHHAIKHAHTAPHHPKKSDSSSSNIFSQFLKSAFGGL